MDKTLLDMVVAVNAALAGLPSRDRLDVISIAWLTVANNVRTEALSFPGGYPTEQARQVTLLQNMVNLVANDEPDLEMERLYHEGDLEGMARRIQDLMTDSEEGGGDGPTT